MTHQDYPDDPKPELSLHELAAREAHYRRLFEASKDGILVIDADTGNIVDVNPFLTTTIGFTRQDILNKPIWELGFLEKIFADKAKLAELKQPDYMLREKLPLKTAVGSILDVEIIGSGYEIEHKKLIQLNIHVIKERKEAELRLEESELRFRHLIEEAPIGIALSQNGKTVYINSRYLKMFGFETQQELLGTSFLDQVAPQSRVEVIERAMQQEQGLPVDVDYDIQGLRKDGSQFPFQALISRVELITGPALIGYFTDVTKRKQAETNLRDTEEKFRLLAENAQDLVFRYRLLPTPGYEYVSPSALRIVGYTPEEYYDDPALGLKMVLPEDRVNVEAAIANPQVMPSTPIVMRCIRKDGQIIWLEQMNSVIRDSHGAAIALQGVARDITERKKAEIQIEYLASYPALNPNLVTEINSDGSIRYANPAAQKRFHDLISRDSRHPFLAQWQDIMAKIITAENRQLFREVNIDGRYYEQLMQYLNSSKTIRIYGRDITESKIAEEARAASEIRYRRLFEAARDGILILDADTGIVVDVNPFLVQLLGFSHKEILGNAVWELGFSKDILANKENFLKLQEQDYVRYDDLPLETVDGRRIEVEFVSNVYEVNHRRVIQCNIRDITQRKQAETENKILRDKAEMASRLAAVGEMAAGIAHEINNPLTGVIGFSELLLERPGLPEDVREELRIINDSSLRVRDIIKRMLTFARQVEPQRRNVSINELLDNTLELRDYVLKTANIKVVKQYDPDLPWVYADPGQLQQVFLNLIVNAEYAMKKTNKNGVLILKTERFGDYVQVSITDNGTGMSETTLAKLFQPFFTTKDPGEGTGLGLSLSHGIIQEHFGTIRAESAVGHGATFIIELPVPPVEIPPIIEEPMPEPVKAVKHARILVVDDEPTVRLLMRTILTRDGHVVEECDDSRQVMQKLQETGYDVILLDLRMPGMSGMELFSAISTRWPKLAQRIIFITGDTSDSDTREYLANHQIPFITKPFDKKTLEDKVNALLAQIPE